MSSLLDLLGSQLSGSALEQMSGTLGADKAHRALERDHDGSILDNLGSLLGNPQAGAGDGILRHVLNGERRTVESNAPAEMGMLGKLLDADNDGDVDFDDLAKRGLGALSGLFGGR